MKKIALLTLLLINLSLSFSLPRNQASPAIFSVTKTNNSILFRHTDSTLTAIPCQSVASIVSNADPSKIVSVWVVQQGDYDKIMQFDYSVCGFSSKSDAVDSLTAWAICDTVGSHVFVSTDSATVTQYNVLNSQNTPPVSPSTGDVYLVGTVPTGAWVGHAKDIAEWDGADWVFTDGVQGDFLYNATNALTYIFRSGNWVQTTGIPALNNGNTISSGLRIGTNNARSLTFETNNVNRGRFDSIGRFYINDTSLRKSNKYLQIDSITGRLIASEVSGNTSSSLFPNGQEIVTESRDFRDSDIDKLLIVVGNDITLTMPDSIVFSEQLRTIGLKFLQGYTGCGYQTIHGFTSKVLQLPSDGEFITLITGEYLGKSSVGSIANMQVNSDDGIVTLNKYLYDKSQQTLTFSTGLTNTSSTITNNLSTGVSGGQSVIGGTASGENLTLSSTTNATKGKILFGTSAYDEVNNRLGIGTTVPPTKLSVVSGSITGSGASDATIQLRHATENVGHSTAIEFSFGNGNNSYCGSRILGETANGGGGNLHFQTGSNSFGTYSTKMYIEKAGNVGIGTTTPVASAKLEVSSTTSGFLPPRMTATQASAISTPAQGLLLFVSDTNGTFTSVGWWGYNGSTWEKLNN